MFFRLDFKWKRIRREKVIVSFKRVHLDSNLKSVLENCNSNIYLFAMSAFSFDEFDFS